MFGDVCRCGWILVNDYRVWGFYFIGESIWGGEYVGVLCYSLLFFRFMDFCCFEIL